MGVVNCSMEARRQHSLRQLHFANSKCFTQVYGNFPGDPMLEQHFDSSNPDSIPCTVKRVNGRCSCNVTKRNIIEQVLSMAKEQGIDTNTAAVMMADAASLVAHPITGHRCTLLLFCFCLFGWMAITIECSEERSSYNGLLQMAGRWAPMTPFEVMMERENFVSHLCKSSTPAYPRLLPANQH
jgi:hypothetical protein